MLEENPGVRIMKRPAVQLYTGDWLKDPCLGQCSPATRGIWIDLLALMHENSESGELTGTPASLAQIARCTERQMKSAIEELERTKTADVTKRPNDVTVKNRRMSRAYHERLSARKRKQKQRGTDEPTANVTPNVTEKSRSYSSSSPSTTVKDPPIKPPQSFFLPEWIDPEAWAGFVEMRQRIRAPMTDRAKRLAINALQKHRDAGENPTDLLNASTQNSWKGFWPNTKTNGGTNGKRFETAFDRLHRACADPAPGNGRGETIEGHAEILGADG